MKSTEESRAKVRVLMTLFEFLNSACPKLNPAYPGFLIK